MKHCADPRDPQHPAETTPLPSFILLLFIIIRIRNALLARAVRRTHTPRGPPGNPHSSPCGTGFWRLATPLFANNNNRLLHENGPLNAQGTPTEGVKNLKKFLPGGPSAPPLGGVSGRGGSVEPKSRPLRPLWIPICTCVLILIIIRIRNALRTRPARAGGIERRPPVGRRGRWSALPTRQDFRAWRGPFPPLGARVGARTTSPKCGFSARGRPKLQQKIQFKRARSACFLAFSGRVWGSLSPRGHVRGAPCPRAWGSLSPP